MAYQFDSRTALIDHMAQDPEHFRLVLTMLPKSRSVEAIKMRYDAEDMLLKFAYNPNADIDVPPEPQPPILNQDTMSEEEIEKLRQDYREMKMYWNFARQANARKVSIADYLAIKDHFIPFDRTISALSGVKGKLMQMLTKRVDELQQKKGLMASLGGSDKE